MKRFDLNKRAFLKTSGTAAALGFAPAVDAKVKSKSSTKPVVAERQLTANWEFRQVGKGEWLKATVPGTVHTDLLANKKIGDPFYRTNERDQQWIDKEDWEYRTTLTLDDATLKHSHIELHFYGLDTYADVYVNDTKILSADNMFREWGVDIKAHARLGKNTVRIVFASPIRKGLAALEAFGMPLPSTNDQSQNGGLGDKKVGIFTRKAGYHYGWDWGPRFVTSGVWRPVALRAWSGVRIDDLHIVQDELSPKTASLTAVFEIMADAAGKATVEITSPTNKAITARETTTLKLGLNRVELKFAIQNPKLWWSNGLGEAHLYNLTGRVISASGGASTRTVKTGLRTVRVVQTPDDQGSSFYIELNGVPVFMKGANYIPNDSFLPRVTHATYDAVIRSAVDTHMNMLRVWGGGIYEDDYFYDQCDRHGILVWQDFMFACSMFPDDAAFLDNVRKEAEENVRRLRNHPSIALWCGNNEIDSAWQADVPNGGWGWKQAYTPAQQARLTKAYDAIFHEVLAKAVAQHDPQRFYWPSSPLAAWDGHNKVVHADLALDKQSGDIHYWSVWHGKKPFAEYRTAIGRFMSEYGFQSFPEYKTVQAYTEPGDHDILSEVMKAHQRSDIGNETIRVYMERDYKVPTDFRQFLYVGQVLQAEGIKVAMEAHRLRMPYCMGSLFWQINDCWPVASWSSIDYFGRWKAQQYFAVKAFAPVLVSPQLEGSKLTISVVSDLLTDLPATLSVRVIDFSGKVISEKPQNLTIKANTSAVVSTQDVVEWLKGAAPEKTLLVAQLAAGDKILSENILYFKPVKDLRLPTKTEVRREIRSVGKELVIGLTSATLLKNVYLSLEIYDGQFSDNYFDLLPGEVRLIHFTPAKPVTRVQFGADLKLMHMAEISAA